ncbi:probable serine/threonine-protein kinase DDB_G0292354 isoform X2 [Schistocerca gregaria]|uniref:probable serine/threonine-protein kinase DDB_G0292354 isoform X2 n=1 Tax=Schistocerca gregaria TaxID=7010 RepID=UPI00211E4A91|nr:probable serine/threonine-protein kinase DDB_G0292354 isoform X2 [Schistocerca gregaria]
MDDNRCSRTDSNTKLYLFNVGDKIDTNYTIIAQIGRGGYGEIYKARRLSDGLVVAVKVEKSNKPGNLVQEIRVLKVLQDCGARHIPKLLAAGQHLGISYMVMELLGQNLSTHRNHRPSLIFTLRCTCIIAILMLKAIKQVHDYGFLHRDIKPTNFVIGSFRDPRELFIIDFGLSKQYVKPDGTLIAKRPRSRWVGSWRYMSPNVHLQKDHGRRDDMWGFLYVIIELYLGTLPWKSIKGPKNVDRIRDIKLAYMNERLTCNLPDEFTLILNHIRTLSFESRPNYRYLHTLLMTMYLREGGTKDSARARRTLNNPKAYL